MMKHELEMYAQKFGDESPLHFVVPEKGQKQIRLFETPIFGYAQADDPFFLTLQRSEAIGPHFRLPETWLKNAKTVISFFLPFSEEVRLSNRAQQDMPSENWLYGRIEGQRFVFALCNALEQKIREAGFDAVIPSSSEDFWSVSPPDANGMSYTSNWSERHVAFACGLGTFGLSKGLITQKGIAGRFGSLVTNWETPPTPRPYTQIYEYCTRCGKCAARCPGQAITLENGKDHQRCYEYQMGILPHLLPRYGCGLCQTDVPCEHCRPGGI